MSVNDAQGWLLIIAAIGGIITTLVASVITAVMSVISRQKLIDIKDNAVQNASKQEVIQGQNATKLEVIHQATNGGLVLVQGQLEAAAAQIVALKNEVELLKTKVD